MNAIPNSDQYDRNQVEISKLVAETMRALEEVRKTTAETREIERKTWFHPFLVVTGLMTAGGALMGAAIALAKVLLHMP